MGASLRLNPRIEMVKNGFHSKAFRQLLDSAFLLNFVLPAISQISQTSAKTQQRGTQPDHRLSAEEVARKYLPAVVLIICDDAKGNAVQASGFFISRGLIVTNYHVIEGMVRGYVKLAPLPSRKVTTLPINSILDFDRTEDLALLSVNVKSTSEAVPSVGLTPEVAELAEIGRRARGETPPTRPSATSSSDDPLGINEFLENESIPILARFDEPVKVGETIYVLGNPEGLVGSISQGIVSGIRRSGDSRLIQITAAISPGSSGGPVINTKGRVIGVVAASLTEGQSLNFAIPSQSVRKLMPRFNLRMSSSTSGAWTIRNDLSSSVTPEPSDTRLAPTPTPTSRSESLIDVSDVLKGGDDTRTYRFHLDHIARIKGTFTARGNITVRIVREPMEYYSSRSEVSADSIDVSLWDGTYEVVISARRPVGFSVSLTAYYPW